MTSGAVRIGRTELCFYVLTAVLIIGLKLAWRDVSPTEPRVFLGPLIAGLKLLTGSDFIRRPDGFFSPALGVLITKECGGMNYFLIAHGLLVLAYIGSFRGWARLWAYLTFFIGTFGMTLFANMSRVMIAITLGRSGMFPAALAGKPHLALGAFVYFWFLWACYGLAGIVVRHHTGNREGVP